MEGKEGSILDCQIVAWLQSSGPFAFMWCLTKKFCGDTVGGRCLQARAENNILRKLYSSKSQLIVLKSIARIMIALKGVNVFPVTHAVVRHSSALACKPLNSPPSISPSGTYRQGTHP